MLFDASLTLHNALILVDVFSRTRATRTTESSQQVRSMLRDDRHPSGLLAHQVHEEGPDPSVDLVADGADLIDAEDAR